MEKINRKKSLGRGLSTLLAETQSDDEKIKEFPSSFDSYLPIEKIIPNFTQPRKNFDQLKLEELSKSINSNGIIQPIIVRPKDTRYEIIAGERRWRAAQLSKVHSVPAIVRELTDEQAAEYAIAENIQREDLNPIDEARAYKNLLEKFSYTQEEISKSLGKSRSYIANMLRLLTLPASVLSLLEESKISIGHARALIGLENAELIARKILKNQLSVRDTEALVKVIRIENLSVGKKYREKKKDVDTLNLEKALSFQTKFKITIDQEKTQGIGKISFNYRSLEEFDRICKFLNDI